MEKPLDKILEIKDLKVELMSPDGLVTAVAINTTRDRFCRTKFETDHGLGTMYD